MQIIFGKYRDLVKSWQSLIKPFRLDRYHDLRRLGRNVGEWIRVRLWRRMRNIRAIPAKVGDPVIVIHAVPALTTVVLQFRRSVLDRQFPRNVPL